MRTVFVIGLCVLLLWGAQSSGQAQTYEEIYSIAWSPSGEEVATGHNDGSVRIWDVVSRHVTQRLEGQDTTIWSIAWSPDGNLIASGSYDGRIVVWNSSGTHRYTLEHGDTVDTLYWLPNHQLISISVGFRISINFKVWYVDENSAYLLDSRRAGAYVDIKADHTGTRLVMQNINRMASVWSTDPLQRLFAVGTERGSDPDDSTYSVAWSPNGERLAMGSQDGKVRIWEAKENGQRLFELQGNYSPVIEWPTSTILAIHFSENGREITSVSGDGTLHTWNTATGYLIHSVHLNPFPIFAAAFSPDGTQLAYGGASGNLKIVPIPLRLPTKTEQGTVSKIAWKPDGSQLAVGYSDGTLEIRDAESGALEQTLTGHTSTITALSWHPTTNQLLSSGAEDELFLWVLDTGFYYDLQESYRPVGLIRSMSWNADGSQIFASKDTHLLIWDAQPVLPQFQSQQWNEYGIYSFAWNASQSRVATVSVGFVLVRNAATFFEWQPQDMIDNGGAGSAAWSPDGDRLVTGDWISSINIWDVSSGDFRLERQLQPALYDSPEYPQTNIQALQFNPTGTEVYSVAGDGTYIRWDASTGDILASAKLTAPINAAAFSPDGAQLAYGGTSGNLDIVHIPLQITAQNTGPDRIFVVTHLRTAQERSSTIWEIDLTTGSATALYTRPADTDKYAPTTLSANELAYFDAELAAGLLFPDSWRDTEPMKRFIHNVWQLDATRLLLLSSTDLCYVRNNGPCFGYYEFEMLDLEHPETTRSLWTLDYHPAEQGQWPGCSVGPAQKIVISDLHLHPTENKVAFTLVPEGNCGSLTAHSYGHTFVIDFSEPQVEVVDVPNASVADWSPDGTRLLVFGLEDSGCHSGGCETFARVYDFSTGVPLLVNEVNYLTSRLVPQPLWLTDTQIVYQGIVRNAILDVQDVLFLSDLTTGEQTEIAYQVFEDLYRLSPDAPYFVGKRPYSDEVALFSLEGDKFTLLNTVPAPYLTDQNNLSDYVLLSQGNYQVLAVGSDLTLTLFDLNTLVSLDTGLGGIVAFSPGMRTN